MSRSIDVTPSAASQYSIRFSDAGDAKWLLAKGTDNSLFVYDQVTGKAVFQMYPGANLKILPDGDGGVQIGSIRITWTRVVAAGVAIAAFAGLYVVLRHTQFGRGAARSVIAGIGRIGDRVAVLLDTSVLVADGDIALPADVAA